MVDSMLTRRTDRIAIPSERRSAAARRGGADEMTTELTALSLRLRAIYAASVAAQLALRNQAAEQDLEIADALRVGVCDALGDRICELDDIILRSAARRSRG